MNRTSSISIFLTLLFCSLSHGQVRSDVLQTSERIRSEERRQVEVRRQIGGASRKIDLLLADLESNGLIKQGKGKVIADMNSALIQVNTKRVPKAASNLQQARLQIEDASLHLEEADKEIHFIIEDLNHLLRASESALIGDILLERIRELIKTQSFLRRETAKWGKMLFINQDAATVDKPRVIRAQNENLQQLSQFKSLLSGAIIDAVEDTFVKRLGMAKNILRDRQPSVLMQNAIATIGQEDAVATVGHQDETIEILKEIERILSSDEDDVADKAEVLEELKRILEAQIELKKEVEEAPKALPEASELQAEQLELEQALEQAVANEPPSNSVNNALDAMQEAASELGEGDQQGTIPPQETAISELQNAVSELEAQIAAEAAAAAADAADATAADAFSEAAGAEPMDSFGDEGMGESFADAFPSDAFG
ncbi:MAG: hypothetical protein HN467_14665, partial [Opitutae bacterium]|nr:hypothetical protein [Opitutae bacterium]